MLYKEIVGRLFRPMRMIRYFLAYLGGLFVSVNDSPILVFGSAKSGTTIIGYLLSEALRKSYTGDIVRAIPDACMTFQLEHGILSINSLVSKYRLEFSRDIIKEPALTNYAGKLIEYYSGGRYVFIIRDPRDNIRSILDRLKMPGNLDNVKLDEWPQLNKTPAWKLMLDDSWKKDRCSGNYIEVLARNWMLAYEQYIGNASQAFLIKYEDFCLNKTKEINMLCERMSLEVKRDISSLVDTQKQGKGHSECDLVEFFGDKNILTIEKVCNKGILDMGYTPSLLDLD